MINYSNNLENKMSPLKIFLQIGLRIQLTFFDNHSIPQNNIIASNFSQGKNGYEMKGMYIIDKIWAEI